MRRRSGKYIQWSIALTSRGGYKVVLKKIGGCSDVGGELFQPTAEQGIARVKNRGRLHSNSWPGHATLVVERE